MPDQETQLKFARIMFPVQDLEMMSAFYRDVLGFSVTDSTDPAKACFDLGGVSLCLHATKTPMRDDDYIGPVLIFAVPDVALLREQLIEQGVRMGKLKSFGALAECDGRDPEGNLFRLTNQA